MSENVSSEQLTRKQETFIAALLTLPTRGAAALAAGVTDKTAQRWMEQPHIQQAYKAARKAAFQHALDALQEMVEDSLKTLCDVRDDATAQHGVRVRAAQILIEQAIKVHELSEMQAEIAELKRVVQEHDAWRH